MDVTGGVPVVWTRNEAKSSVPSLGSWTSPLMVYPDPWNVVNCLQMAPPLPSGAKAKSSVALPSAVDKVVTKQWAAGAEGLNGYRPTLGPAMSPRLANGGGATRPLGKTFAWPDPSGFIDQMLPETVQ